LGLKIFFFRDMLNILIRKGESKMGRKKGSTTKEPTPPLVKKLYKIGHLTKLLGITPRTIRYYDQFGLLPHVKRSAGNVRLFDEEDFEIIKKIRNLQTESYYPLDVIKEILFGKREINNKSDKIVVTDSSAGFLAKEAKDLNIKIIPLSIKIDQTSYKITDKFNLKTLWDRYEETDISPLPQAPDEKVFEQTYLDLHAKGYKEIYSLHLSSALSDVYLNATKAAHKVAHKIKVKVVDAQTLGAGLRLLVEVVNKAITKNNSSEEIDLLIAKNVPLLYSIMTVASLKYLVASKNKADKLDTSRLNLLEKLVQFKPVLLVKNGDFEILECCKERKKALELMTNLINTEIISKGGYIKKAFIYYDYLYTEAKELANNINTLYKDIDVVLQTGNPVVSAYIGTSSIGISFL
jgi:DegV family protein with EDD domain